MSGAPPTLAEAARCAQEHVRTLEAEPVPATAARGRVLVEDVTAWLAVPAFRESETEGYAVRTSDVPGTLEVLGELRAPDRFEGTLARGQAIRVAARTEIPDGADAVLRAEDARVETDHLEVDRPVRPGSGVTEPGSQFTPGETVLRARRRLTARDVAVLTALEVDEVSVARRPRVAIASAGTSGRTPLAAAYLLEGLAARDGAEATLLPPADREDALASLLAVNDHDVVVVLAGSGIGFDPAFASRTSRAEPQFTALAVDPPLTTWFGVEDHRVFAFVPGAPSVAAAAWDFVVRPAVLALSGLEATAGEFGHSIVRGRLARRLSAESDREHVVWVTLAASSEGPPLVSPLPEGSAHRSGLARAAGFVVLNDRTDHLAAGDEVNVHVYG